MKLTLATNTIHTCTQVVFKNISLMNLHSLVLRFSQNLFTNVMKTNHTTPHTIKRRFIQYKEGFNFVSGTPLSDFDDVPVTISDGPPPLTPYTKANIRDGHVIPQESKMYRKLVRYKLFRKQNWFGVVLPNLQIDAKLDYLISRVLLEIDQTGLNIYKKLCDLDHYLQQTAFSLLTQNFPSVGYVITGQRNTFGTLKSKNVISLFRC